jgi:hypothetical protein
MNWFKKASQKISYTGVILDEQSHNLLLDKMSTFVPGSWKRYAHHMTINLGPAKDPEKLGSSVKLVATQWAKDDKVLAVMVEGLPVKDGRTPHVTVAVNAMDGGKPKDSNNLKSWQPISEPIILNGVIKEVAMQ